MVQNKPVQDKPVQGKLAQMVLLRYILAILLVGAIVFVPSGTLAYWEGWAYMAILFIPMGFTMVYLLRNAPELLERRMHMRERETAQSRIVALTGVYSLVVFLLPGLDHRFGWSHVPVPLVLLGCLLVLLGYGIIILVFRENQYASRVVEVAQGQVVISSGPYAHVRHPMYSGVLLLYIFSPLALGSYWGMLPALLIIPLLVARLRSEEEVLARDLPGYRAYQQRVRYRLLPRVW